MNSVANLGACLSDLVACVHALVTEGETGRALQQRMLEIYASTNAIVRHADKVAEDRRNESKKT